jgi:hypothetical protein
MSSEGGSSILLLPLKIFLVALDVLVREEKKRLRLALCLPTRRIFMHLIVF